MIADIKTARLNAGLKRHEFARRVGVSAVAVWKWETGKTQLGTKRLHLVCPRCGLKLNGEIV